MEFVTTSLMVFAYRFTGALEEYCAPEANYLYYQFFTPTEENIKSLEFPFF